MEKIQPNKIKTLQHVINQIDENAHDLSIPRCGLFLGAGCSISSGIKSGWGIVELCQKLSFIKNQPKSRQIIENNTVEQFINENQHEFNAFVELKHGEFRHQIDLEKDEYIRSIPIDIHNKFKNKTLLWESYKESFFNSSLYGKWFETYSENPIDRQKLIEKEIEKGKPSGEYLVLSYLIELGRFNNIFTTNFDDLINDSLIEFIGRKSKVYAHNEIANFIDIFSKRPNIIKLHGDYLFQNIKNTENETSSLFGNMRVKLRDSLLKTDLVVIGYGGSDYSVMDALLKIKEEHSFGLYWCSMNIENENWRVKHLINSTKNSFFVEMDGFESFTDKLYERYHNEIQPYPLAERIEPYKKTVNDTLEKLNNKITLNTVVNEIDLAGLTNKIVPKKEVDIFLGLPSFNDKMEYLTNLEFQQLGRMIYYLHLKSPKHSHSFLGELIKQNILIQKIEETPITVISNTLTRLYPINNKYISDLIGDNPDVFYRKIKTASIGEKIAITDELKKINPTVISEIMGKVKYAPIDYQTTELRYLSRLIYNDDFNYNVDEILDKFYHSSMADIRTFISKIDIERSKELLEKFEDDLLMEKLEESTLNIIGQTFSTFNKIDPFITKKLYRNSYKIINTTTPFYVKH